MVIDLNVIIQAQKGDKNAFGVLYDSVSSELYRYALYTLGNAHDAEDAVADTFLDAYRGIKNLQSEESFRPWIFRILSVKCRRMIGGYIRERGNVEIEDYAAECLTAAPDSTKERTELAEAMGRLTSEEREIVTLCTINGYTMKETAQMLGLPQGTVSSKLHRTLKKLRVMLEK